MRAPTETDQRSPRVPPNLAIGSGLALICLILAVLIGNSILQNPKASVSLTAVIEDLNERWPAVPQMTTAELARRLALPGPEDQPTLIDVRGPGEYEVSHLPGAVNVGSPEAVLRFVQPLPPGTDIVLYCSVGVRSSAAASKLLEGGRSNVYNLEGSIFKWANEGRPLVSNGQPAGVVHPYDQEWGRLLDAPLHPRAE